MKLFSTPKNRIISYILFGACLAVIIYVVFTCTLFSCIDPGSSPVCDEKCQEKCYNTMGFSCRCGGKILDFTFQKPWK